MTRCAACHGVRLVRPALIVGLAAVASTAADPLHAQSGSARDKSGRPPAPAAPAAPTAPANVKATQGVPTITVGATRAATLPAAGAPALFRWITGTHEAVQLDGAACDRLRITVRAPGFRPRIHFGPGNSPESFKERASRQEDDATSIDYTLPRSGPYWVVVSDARDRAEMRYELAVERLDTPGVATGARARSGGLDSPGVREVTMGGQVSSALPPTPPNGAVWERLWFWGDSGTRRVVTTTSDAFRPVAFVDGPTPCVPVADLDMGMFPLRGAESRGPTRHARSVDLPATGWYRITVNESSGGRSGGAFTLATSDAQAITVAAAPPPRPAARPSTPTPVDAAPSAPTAAAPAAPSQPRTIEEIADAQVRLYESQGMRLQMREDWMALRRNSWYVDAVAPRQGVTYRFVILEAGGLASASVTASQQLRRSGEWEEVDRNGLPVTFDQLPGGVLRTGTRFSVSRALSSDHRLTFEVNAGAGPGASARRVIALVFIE